MITAVRIENFKAIADSGWLPLRRVNLVFGANGGGKSSLLEAFLYAHEMASTWNPEVRKTRLGGELVDLGGLASLAHRPSSDTTPRLPRISFRLPLRGQEGEGATSRTLIAADAYESVDISFAVTWRSEDHSAGVDLQFHFHPAEGLVETLHPNLGGASDLEIVSEGNEEHSGGPSSDCTIILRSVPHARPQVTHSPRRASACLSDQAPVYLVSTRGRLFQSWLSRTEPLTEPSPSLSSELPDLEGSLPARLLGPFVGRGREAVEALWREYPIAWDIQPERHLLLLVRAADECLNLLDPLLRPNQSPRINLWSIRRLVDPPRRNRPNPWRRGWAQEGRVDEDPVSFEIEAPSENVGPLSPSLDQATQGLNCSPEELPYFKALLIRMAELHGKALNEILSLLNHEMESLAFLGPLRAYPDRFASIQPVQGQTLAADGSQAWLNLARDGVALTKVNDWLERLKIPYRLEQRYIHSSMEGSSERRGPGEAATDPFHQLFRNQELCLVHTHSGLDRSLRDLGFGLSQILPVIAGAALLNKALFLVEQPELHAHPRLQADLGDVLLESALRQRRGNTLLIETHSEHLILRMLRRIRMREPVPGTQEVILLPRDLSVLHVSPPDPASGRNGALIKVLEVDEYGDFTEPWPGGFFEERLAELLPPDDLSAWTRGEGSAPC